MIALSNIRIQYGGRVVLDNVSTTIGPRDRIGLVGRNGAGKSTLMKVIAGHIRTFEGGLSLPTAARIGFLHQDMNIPKGKSVIEETMTAFEEVLELENRLASIQRELERRDDYESKGYMDLLNDFSDAEERFRHLGGATMHADAERILSGLGFKVKDFGRLTDEFSGGWQMRVELAKMLLQKPEYLLLDEPTNHLDIESIIWLEGFLKDYEGAVVVISHDRTFLDNVTKRTLEIELGRLSDYKAPYSLYLELRADRREKMESAYANQQQKIAQTERLIEKFRAKATKAKMAQSLIKQLDRMDRLELQEEDTSSMRLRFPPAPRCGDIAVQIEGLSKSYGDLQVLDHIDFQLDRGERVAFVGKNGEGKTTLAKIILGLEAAQGSLKLGHNVSIGYYAQNQSDALHGSLTVLQTIEQGAPPEMRPRLRNILGSFLFSGEDADKKVSVLSGGERARLALACLLLKPINLLVLDEPTNHLDMISKEVLKEAILQYDGALIVVSHDRDFLTDLCGRTVEFRNRKLHNYLGDIQYFLEKRNYDDLRAVSLGTQNNKATAAAAATQQQPSGNGAQKSAPRVLDAEEQKEFKRRQRIVQQSEKRIEELEKQIHDLEGLIADTTHFGSPAYQKNLAEYEQRKKDLDAEMARWEEAQSALDEL